ncbi:PREDICTED: LOB domain-containing protein 15-like isoform X1 [Ipomoea nil]|uniref:LOB domain-containing protein 15-like isoform X1 n=2 Tax=Ipomoea nil TaxID=35883 RepID=UPI000901157C|nr:PREDICTED: LOB domain-containing protein 15-like isoform X1 [Ipomoea nil]
MSRERERYEEIGKKIKREHDDLSQMGRRPPPPPPGGTLNTITPCAACKLLRRRCTQECPFSPYFSPHEPHKFASVHKVFGASNVSKMLMEVPERQRAETANSLVYEANVRLRDPVYGCMGAISALQQKVQALQAELNAVKTEIMRYKFGEGTNNDINTIIPSSHHHHANASSLLTSGVVSVAAPPPSSSSFYTPPPSSSSAADFGIVSSENISYFG